MSGFSKNVVTKGVGLQWPCFRAEQTLCFLEGFSRKRERERERERVCVCVCKQCYCDIIHITFSPPFKVYSHIQFSSVAQSCPTLCDPLDCSTPGFPVLHQLLELAQTHVRQVGDAIQPSHPLLSPSPPALNLSQHQGLLQ